MNNNQPPQNQPIRAGWAPLQNPQAQPQNQPQVQLQNQPQGQRPGAQAILGLLQNWLGQEPGIQFAVRWNGGWERWAQGQWAVWTAQNQNQHGWAVALERGVYAGNIDRADLVFSQQGQPDVIVELKCWFNGDTQPDFHRRAYDDVNKMRQQLEPAYANATAVVVTLIPTLVLTEIGIKTLLAVGTNVGFTDYIRVGNLHVCAWVGP